MSDISRTLLNCNKDLERITQAIINKKLILFIGAGVSMNVGMKSWYDFLQQLISEIEDLSDTYLVNRSQKNNLKKCKTALADYDYELCAQMIKRIMDSVDSKNFKDKLDGTFYTRLNDEFKSLDPEILNDSQIYMGLKTLFELGANKILTTNYDKNIEDVTGIEEPLIPFDKKPVGKIAISDLRKIRKESEYVFKLHGEKFPVLTAKSYDRIYKEDSQFVELLKDLFNNNIVLFIGSSLQKDRTVEVLNNSEFCEAYALFADSGKSSDWATLSSRLKKHKIKPIRLINQDKKNIGDVYKEQLPKIFATIGDKLKFHHKKINDSFKKEVFQFGFPSAERFFNDAKESVKCVFFNTQIDIGNWFNPNFQLHLNLQKAALRARKLDIVSNCYNNNTDDASINECKKHIPAHSQARIIFLPEHRLEFNTKLEQLHDTNFENTEEIYYSHFKVLTYIHSLISCPLGIITVDEFAEMILKSKSTSTDCGFFDIKENLRYLGLSDKIASINLSGIDGDAYKRFRNQLIRLLKRDITYQTNNALFKPDDIDFAYLEKQDSSIEIWEADVFNSTLEYYKSTNLNTLSTKYSTSELDKRKQVFVQFAQIICREVFKQEERINLVNGSNKFTNINPQYSLYSSIDPSSDVLKIKEDLMFNKKQNAFEIIQKY